MFRLPPIIDAPFIVSDTTYINPKYRGTRLPFGDEVDQEELQETYFRKQFRVHDARMLKRAPSLEIEGFQLLQAPLPQLDFDNHELVTTRFYQHCNDLVKTASRCHVARAVQHEFRIGKLIPGTAGMGIYGAAPHTDMTPPIEDIVESRSGRHFAIYNIWRSIDPERYIEVMPLALCDVNTVGAADLIYGNTKRRTIPQTRLIYCRLIHNPDQCWYYFPRMTPGEVLIFKQYDTREENPCLRSTFHGAFKDPTTRKGAPLRKSVEVRVMATFPEKDTDRERRKERFRAQVPDAHLDGSFSQWRYEKMTDWIYE